MKHFRTAIMAACTLSLLMSPALSAKHLSPEQALQAYKSQSPSKKISPSVDYSLAFTQYVPKTSEAGVYVFARGDAGYVVLPADDAMPVQVLGYSDAGTFDAENMPEQMRWLLEYYAACVAECAQAPDAQQALRRADREAVAPICKTQWGQGSPYNTQCPLFGTSRAVTGCVATAMAQVIKGHEWPLQGTGYHQYTYEYNGRTYTESLDFSGITYDWDNMLNVYDGSASTTQKKAVATLMHSCGVAADMVYSPEASGATDFAAGQGMIEYLGYDKAMNWLLREWYTNSEWVDLLYSEMAAGRPVLFGGLDVDQNGHEFVIDGYNDGFFHVNWGWDGYYDGYFDIFCLYPLGQGTGGGSGQSGYDFNQSILVNIRPSYGSEEYAGSIGNYGFYSGASEYYRSPKQDVEFYCGLYSYALAPLNYTIGLKLVTDDGRELYLPAANDVYLDTFVGINYFSINTTVLPVGKYKVYPAFKTATTDWQTAHYDKAATLGYLDFNVTDNMIYIEEPKAEQGDISAELAAVYSVNGTDTKIYAGHEYDFDWVITTTGAWDGTIYCLLINTETYDLLSWADPKRYQVPSAGEGTIEYRMYIDENIPTGSYGVCLAEEREDALYIIDGSLVDVTVHQPDSSDGEGSVTDITFVGSQNQGESWSQYALIDAADPHIEVTLQCTIAPWTDDIFIAFGDPETYEITDYSETKSVTLFNVGDEVTLSFDGPWGLEAQRVYVMAVFSNTIGQMSGVRYFELVQKGDAYVSLVEFVGSETQSATIDNPAILNPAQPQIKVSMRCTEAPWEDKICLVFADANTLDYLGETESHLMYSPVEGTTYSYTFSGPWSCIEEGRTYAMVVWSDNKGQLTDVYYFRVESLNGEGRVTNVQFADSEYKGTSKILPAILQEENQEIEVEFSCTKAPWEGSAALVFSNLNTGAIVSTSAYQDFSIDSTGKYNITFEGPWEGLALNTVYVLNVEGKTEGNLSRPYYFKIIPKSGIADIIADENAETEYYTPQGVKVLTPDHGVYIMKEGDKVTKILK